MTAITEATTTIITETTLIIITTIITAAMVAVITAIPAETPADHITEIITGNKKGNSLL